MKIKLHLHYLKADYKAEIGFIINKIIELFHVLIYSILAYLKINFYGGHIGNHCKFLGPIIYRRFQLSNISIGHHCNFISLSRYNFRGVNHPMIIQTGKEGAEITIGNHCGFTGASIVANSKVIIEDFVIVGANSIIGDRDGHSELYASENKCVTIRHHVWIGMNVTVLKGVTIGENSIIGANSVVTKDIPANVIAAGNPCRIIKDLTK